MAPTRGAPTQDRFGFYLTDEGRASSPSTPQESALEASRAHKWAAMLKDWEGFTKAHPATLKRRCRKGIPNRLRGRAWLLLSGGAALRAAQPSLYAECLAATPARADVTCIGLDLPRTYPQHYLFASKGEGNLSTGQLLLRNVLSAFACYEDPADIATGAAPVGYCQVSR